MRPASFARGSAAALAATLTLAAPAFAAGDATKGEAEFGKCRACHMISDGDTVIRAGGRAGPNLWDVVGRPAAATDYRYGPGLKEAAAMGLVWTEALIADYLADPSAFLKAFTGDPGARSKMTFKLKNGADVAAYLAGLGAAE